VREELRLPLRRVLDRARSTNAVARETGVAVVIADQRRTVTLEVIPFLLRVVAQRYFLVLFEDVTPAAGIEKVMLAALPTEADAASEDALRGELASTRQYLESVIEQLEVANEDLRAANEEIVSSNEELRSTNEELQSAKEELQATNEELRTVNDEMGDRSVEATRLSDDLTNVLTSMEIPILIAGRDGRLRRFTPAAGRVFGLSSADLGGPLPELRPLVSMASSLPGIVGKVLEQLQPLSLECQDASGHWYELWVRPYLTLDGRVDGTVMVARDIDSEKKVNEYQERLRRMAFDATLTEERERRRIALEVHDRMGGNLAVAQIKLASLRSGFAGETRAAMDEVVKLLEQTIADKRTLVFELSPPLLYDLGLKEALSWFAEDLEKRHGLKVEVTDDGADKPLSDAAKAIAFRTVRELVMNVLKHANAPAAKVSLRRVDDHLEIGVEDHGAGFDVGASTPSTDRGGFGLLSAREQITGLGGTVTVESVRGLGTLASVNIPLEANAPSSKVAPEAGAV
jgi:signal transduction histidine kinase